MWVEADEAIQLNRLIVASTGERHHLRDGGLLDSALHVPVNLHHYKGVEDVVILSTALLFAIARNHPFQQGNKRTGFEAAVTFLENNGYDLAIPDQAQVGEWIGEVIAHQREITFIENFFSDHLHEI